MKTCSAQQTLAKLASKKAAEESIEAVEVKEEKESSAPEIKTEAVEANEEKEIPPTK